MATDNKILTGARAFLQLGNEGPRLAYCTGVDLFDGITYEPVKVLGNIRTETFVPVDYNCSMRSNRVVVIGKSLVKLGIFPDSAGDDYNTFLNNILTFDDLTAVIFDVGTANQSFTMVHGVRMQSRSKSIEPGRLVFENVDFVAKFANESGDKTEPPKFP